MFRNVAVWVTIVAVRRLNVNPPTLQRPGVAAVNIHGLAIAALVPSDMPEKSPDVAATFEKPRFPFTSRHRLTLVAASRCDESNRAAAAKSIVPFIFVAWASCVERAVVTRPAASTANRVFVGFFMCSRGLVVLLGG